MVIAHLAIQWLLLEGIMRNWILGGVLGPIIVGVVVYWLTEGTNRHTTAAQYSPPPTSSFADPSPPVPETRTPLTPRTRSQIPYAGTSMEGCGYGWGNAAQCEEAARTFSRIDRVLESMEWGNIAFNAPSSMNLKDSAQIQLLLSLEQSIEDLRNMITAAGEKEGVSIHVYDMMEARLSGQRFQITAITPEIQAIASTGVTEWKWEIKPTSSGRHQLHLTLAALFNVGTTSTRRTIRTFDKTIEVEVTWGQSVSGFIGENWQWLWTALLIPVAGWLCKHRSRVQPTRGTLKPRVHGCNTGQGGSRTWSMCRSFPRLPAPGRGDPPAARE